MDAVDGTTVIMQLAPVKLVCAHQAHELRIVCQPISCHESRHAPSPAGWLFFEKPVRPDRNLPAVANRREEEIGILFVLGHLLPIRHHLRYVRAERSGIAPAVVSGSPIGPWTQDLLMAMGRLPASTFCHVRAVHSDRRKPVVPATIAINPLPLIEPRASAQQHARVINFLST